MSRYASLFLVVAVLGVPCVALADDLNPPNQPVTLPGNITWARGYQFSTSAEWEFLTNANPISPDGTVPVNVGNFPINGPLATMTNLTYSNDGLGMDGWLAGAVAGSIILDIPNWIDNEPFKYLHLQVSYYHPGPDSTMSINVEAFDSHGAPAVHFQGSIDGNFLLDPEEHYLYQFWQIIPNPDWERITIDVPAGYFIDEIVVDTISIPEPATMGLLAAGAVVGLIRRRRRA